MRCEKMEHKERLLYRCKLYVFLVVLKVILGAYTFFKNTHIYIWMHLFNLELVMKESALKLSFKRRTLYIEYQLTTTGGAHAEYRLSTAAAARFPR